MKKIKNWTAKNIHKILVADLLIVLGASTYVIATPQPGVVERLSIDDSTYSTAELDWKKAPHAKSYRIYRSEDGENFEYIDSTTETKYTDKGLVTGRTYYYTVGTRNGFKSSEMDAAAAQSVTPALDEPALQVDTDDGEMMLKFSKIDGAIGYDILRDGEVIGQATDTSYVDTSAQGDKDYTYEVRAYRYKKEPVYSELSNSVAAVLHAVGDFNVDIFDNDLVFKWARSDHYSSYKVYNGEELLAETSENKYQIDDLELDKTYDIKVVGFNAEEDSQSPETGRRFQVTEEPMDNQGAIDAAVDWGIKIANDNSFTYGTGRRSHRYGCYFCQTNVGPRKNIKGKSRVNGHSYEKTYCCNPFVHACYAHGAGDPAMLKACRNGKGIAMTQKSYTRYGCWKNVGKVSRGNLKKGDVLVRSNHVFMYIGNGQIVHAAGGGWDAGSIQVTKLGGSKYTFVMRYTGTGSGTMKVIKDVDENGNAIEQEGNAA